MTSTRFIIYGYNNGNNSQPWNDRLGSLANERVYPSFHILNATMLIMARAVISRTFFLKNFVDTSREYAFHLIFFLLKFSKLLISIEKKKYLANPISFYVSRKSRSLAGYLPVELKTNGISRSNRIEVRDNSRTRRR